MEIFCAATFDYVFIFQIYINMILFTLSCYRKGISENYKRSKIRLKMLLQKTNSFHCAMPSQKVVYWRDLKRNLNSTGQNNDGFIM